MTTRVGSSGHGVSRMGSFTGKAVDVGIVGDSFLANMTPAGYGIKKAGIPANTDPWLRTNMEIILGRRNNAVTVPKKRELTFSATPTQAECEDLYNYANDLQDALNRLITRLDS